MGKVLFFFLCFFLTLGLQAAELVFERVFRPCVQEFSLLEKAESSYVYRLKAFYSESGVVVKDSGKGWVANQILSYLSYHYWGLGIKKRPLYQIGRKDIFELRLVFNKAEKKLELQYRLHLVEGVVSEFRLEALLEEPALIAWSQNKPFEAFISFCPRFIQPLFSIEGGEEEVSDKLSRLPDFFQFSQASFDLNFRKKVHCWPAQVLWHPQSLVIKGPEVLETWEVFWGEN